MSTALPFEHNDDPPRGRSTGSALNDHPTQSAIAIDGWKSLLFGLPFLAGGLATTLIHRATPAPAAGPSMPSWAMEIISGAFLVVGVFLCSHGIVGMIGNWRYRRAARLQPHEPWAYDHRWRRDGSRFSAFDAMLRRLFAVVGWYAFLLPFGWVGLEVPGKRPFLVVAVLLGLFGLLLVSRWSTMLRDFVRYGNSILRFDSFPYFLGDTLGAHLRAPRHVGDLEALDLTLRCVEEQYVTTGTGRDRSTSVVCYEIYADTTTIPRERLGAIAVDGIPVQFPIPADQPPTTLGLHPPTYWEIEAKGTATGADYQAYFLVPVYRRS